MCVAKRRHIQTIMTLGPFSVYAIFPTIFDCVDTNCHFSRKGKQMIGTERETCTSFKFLLWVECMFTYNLHLHQTLHFTPYGQSPIFWFIMVVDWHLVSMLFTVSRHLEQPKYNLRVHVLNNTHHLLWSSVFILCCASKCEPKAHKGRLIPLHKI